MTEQEDKAGGTKGARERMGEGIRSGIGILSALRDALEETIQEARERGDLSAERAREALREALNKAQTAASGARERLDFATHGEMEELEKAVSALNDRVTALETSVFGGSENAGEAPVEEG